MGEMPGRSPSGDLLSNSQGQSQSAMSPYYEIDGSKAYQGAPRSQSSTNFSQDPFSFTSLASALPDPTYQNYSQRYSSAPSPSALMHQQFQSAPQYAGPPAMSQAIAGMQYGMGYQAQYQGMYVPGHIQQSAMNGGNQYYQSQGYVGQIPRMGQNYSFQPGQYTFGGPTTAGYLSARNGVLGDAQVAGQRGSDYSNFSTSETPKRPTSFGRSGPSTVVRGPPRKPRQNGHAIWIGNLPPQTDLMSLVLHVCKEAPGLESLFLISKSNCAFANFKDEANCSSAQVKIHDSRFQSVRLVSRLRRNSVGTATGGGVPTDPAASSLPTESSASRNASSDNESRPRITEAVTEGVLNPDGDGVPKDKFFIVKSLTIEDLDLSVRNGIWATQVHNEEALNKAYQDVENVYLIFSANKSGEYFGYAKMTSPINDDPAAAIEFAPKAHMVEDPELPRAIPTPASEFAPKGRIIDDSARGTIFWEVERDEVDGGEEEDGSQSHRSEEESDSKSSAKAWGKPFQVEWQSTTRLPFYRTRGLRNSWNSNREVKIARDGTELETNVGRRLIALFHRLPSPVGANELAIPLHGNMPVIGAYPQMRPLH